MSDEGRSWRMLVEVPVRVPPSPLARLRRFARILTGSQRLGDIWVRRTAPMALFDEDVPLTNDEVLVVALRALIEAWEQEPVFGFEPAPGLSPLQEKALREVGQMAPQLRAPFAASWIETFTQHELADIFATHHDAAASLADLIELGASFEERNVLASVDGEQLRLIVQALELLPIGVTRASGWSMVASGLKAGLFDAAIIDPVDDGADILHPAHDLAAKEQITTIWLSHSPDTDRQLAEVIPRMMVGRSLDEFEVADTLRELLYVEPHRWTPADETFDLDADQVDDAALAPALAPIDAEVVDNRLRLAPSEVPASAVSSSALDALRRQLLRSARSQLDHAGSSNIAPRVKDHLAALVELLDQPLTEDMVLGLSVGVDAMSRLLPIIEEELTRLAAADIAGFLLDLQRYTNQFPISRTYNGEAAAQRPIAPAEDEALREVEGALAAQDDAVVAPELKAQLALLGRARARQAGSSIGDVAWVRSISNTLKAVARHIKALGDDLYGEARGTAVKQMGKLIGSLPTAGALYLLATNFPVEFAALTLILQRSKERMGKMVEEGDDKVRE